VTVQTQPALPEKVNRKYKCPLFCIIRRFLMRVSSILLWEVAESVIGPNNGYPDGRKTVKFSLWHAFNARRRGGVGVSAPRFTLEKSPVNFTGGWVNPPGSVWTGV